MTMIVTRRYDYRADAARAVSELKHAGLTGREVHLVAGPEPGRGPVDEQAQGRHGGTIISVHLPAGREAEIRRILDQYPAIDPARPDHV